MKFPIRFLDKVPNVNFIGHRWYGFAITFLGMLITAGSLYFNGLNYGIDFTGGVVLEVRTESQSDLGKMREILETPEFSGAMLQSVGTTGDEVMIRLAPQKGMEQAKVADNVRALLDKKYGEKVDYLRVDYVGAQVGEELITDSLIATGLALFMMLLYLWFRFEWQFGVGGISALLHDAIMIIGFYSVTQIEFNLTSVAAVLTVIGYSINDSVVIYDRVRENLRKYKKMPMRDLIDLSVNETLSRTIITGVTGLMALGVMAFYGGEALFAFAVAMAFGIVVGTYSSIYVAAPILLLLGIGKREGAQSAKQSDDGLAQLP